MSFERFFLRVFLLWASWVQRFCFWIVFHNFCFSSEFYVLVDWFCVVVFFPAQPRVAQTSSRQFRTHTRRLLSALLNGPIGQARFRLLSVLHDHLPLLAKAVSGSSHPDSDGMGTIPAIPYARNVPLLLCHELFNEASLPVLHDQSYLTLSMLLSLLIFLSCPLLLLLHFKFILKKWLLKMT